MKKILERLIVAFPLILGVGCSQEQVPEQKKLPDAPFPTVTIQIPYENGTAILDYFTNKGLPDLLIATQNPNRNNTNISLFPGGKSGYSQKLIASIPLNDKNGICISSGNFDRDGFKDFAVASQHPFSPNRTIYVFFGDEKGNFKQVVDKSDTKDQE